MNSLYRLTRLVGALVAIGLTLTLPQAGAIVGGTADNGTHPNVGVFFINDRPALVVGFCSGSLISPHEFLTAGHCTSVLLPSRIEHYRVSFDDQLSLSPEGVIAPEHSIAVTGWTTHPDYSFPHNDVGVIHLGEDVTGITPIELPAVGFLEQKARSGELDGHTFTQVGYGINGIDRSWKNPQANLVWDQRREFGPEQFQALTPDVTHVFGYGCAGDSGGPSFWGGEYPNLAVGTASSGPYSCVGPGTDQRLDTQSVHDFLKLFTH